MKQKIFTIFLALAASAGTIFAEKVLIGDLYYNLDPTNQTAEVTYENDFWSGNNYSGLTAANIPASVTYNDVTYCVTSIGEEAFTYCTGLTSIEIPNTIISIGAYAFSESGLTSITIPNSITSIENGTFFYCTSLTSIEIPNTIISIGEYAFEGSGLTSVVIPNSVISIGEDAFSSCFSLTSVTINSNTIIGKNSSSKISICSIFGSQVTEYIIGDSVTSIREYAFSYCSSLTSITIPNSVTNIGEYAFSGCYSLTSVHISDLSAWCAITFATRGESNPLYYAQNLYMNEELITDLVIPNDITEIKNYHFERCSGLTSVTIPNSVTRIGEGAFKNCNGLTSVTIPNSVTCIGEYAFAGCSGLTSVLIGSLSAWCAISFGNRTSNPLYFAHNLYMNGELISDLQIPNDITEIKNYVFSGCSSLTSIEIPNSVTSIGEDAFSYCNGLISIEIPESVYSIGSEAFAGCSGLSSITWNAKNCASDNAPFSGCSQIISFTFGEEVEHVPSNLCYGMKLLTSITIPKGCISIGDYAFYNCENILSISLPSTLTTIGKWAFNTQKILNVYNYAITPQDMNCYSGSEYLYRGILANANLYVPQESIETYRNTYFWCYFGNIQAVQTPEPEAIDNVYDDESLLSHANGSKILRNGQLFILRDGKTYTMQGQKVR